eukprot:g22979.t1
MRRVVGEKEQQRSCKVAFLIVLALFYLRAGSWEQHIYGHPSAPWARCRVVGELRAPSLPTPPHAIPRSTAHSRRPPDTSIPHPPPPPTFGRVRYRREMLASGFAFFWFWRTFPLELVLRLLLGAMPRHQSSAHKGSQQTPTITRLAPCFRLCKEVLNDGFLIVARYAGRAAGGVLQLQGGGRAEGRRGGRGVL